MSAKGAQAFSGKLEDLEPDPGSIRHGSRNESDSLDKTGLANFPRKETPAHALALGEVSTAGISGHLLSGLHHRHRRNRSWRDLSYSQAGAKFGYALLWTL